jgi:hypothetical protein
MVDTHRFKLGPVCVRLVAEVAAILARQNDGRLTHVLQVATYLPLDVQSVARILESLEEGGELGVHRVQRDSLSWVVFPDPDIYIHREIDLEGGEHLDEIHGLLRTINALKTDEDWERKMREEHQVLRVAAAAKNRTVELAYLTSRLDLPSAKIQSILNDFRAEGHIGLDYDEDTDTLSYTFPELDYPAERFERNMSVQAEAEPKPSTSPMWAIVGLAMFGLVLVILLVKLAV